MNTSPATDKRIGDWIQTYSGITFYPMEPRPEEILLPDIAHALSMLCRFTGHVKQFYSVAQHSVLVSHYCDPADALWGLLHDASEAYMCDVASPVKRLPFMDTYRIYERQLMGAILERFGLPLDEPVSVKIADKRMLYTEARDLMRPVHPDWNWLGIPYDEIITPWIPEFAEQVFHQRFIELTQ
jgi:hypothetical protein